MDYGTRLHSARTFGTALLCLSLAACNSGSDGNGGPTHFNVTAQSNGGGAISPANHVVHPGGQVSFTVTPAEGYSLQGVEGCEGTLAGNLYTTAVLDAACRVTARFVANQYPVSTLVGAGGSISPSDTQTVERGATTQFEVSVAPGYTLGVVSGCNGTLTGNTYTTGAVDQACTVQARFARTVPPTYKALNDSGILISGNTPAGNNASCTGAPAQFQDCNSGRDAQAVLNKSGFGQRGFDFTKISNSGAELPATAALGSGANDWGCTRDNTTGLMWEVKVNDPAHPRHAGNTYSWFDRAETRNAGVDGIPNGGNCNVEGRCDTEKFMDDVNAAGLCGFSDWQLPTKGLLYTLVHFGAAAAEGSGALIDNSALPNTPASLFWTATPVNSDANRAWYVNFQNGAADHGLRSTPQAVRLVRGVQ